MPTWILLSLLNLCWYSTSCGLYCRLYSNGRTSPMCYRYILTYWCYHCVFKLSGRIFLWILCNLSFTINFKLMLGWILLSFDDYRLYAKSMSTRILLSCWEHSTNHMSCGPILRQLLASCSIRQLWCWISMLLRGKVIESWWWRNNWNAMPNRSVLPKWSYIRYELPYREV